VGDDLAQPPGFFTGSLGWFFADGVGGPGGVESGGRIDDEGAAEQAALDAEVGAGALEGAAAEGGVGEGNKGGGSGFADFLAAVGEGVGFEPGFVVAMGIWDDEAEDGLAHRGILLFPVAGDRGGGAGGVGGTGVAEPGDALGG
jgi:hypothetical protein